MGPAFSVGSGRPILDAWRSWGKPGQPGDRGMCFETPDGEASQALRAGRPMNDNRFGAHTMDELQESGSGRWVRQGRLIVVDDDD